MPGRHRLAQGFLVGIDGLDEGAERGDIYIGYRHNHQYRNYEKKWKAIEGRNLSALNVRVKYMPGIMERYSALV